MKTLQRLGHGPSREAVEEGLHFYGVVARHDARRRPWRTLVRRDGEAAATHVVAHLFLRLLVNRGGERAKFDCPEAHGRRGVLTELDQPSLRGEHAHAPWLADAVKRLDVAV